VPAESVTPPVTEPEPAATPAVISDAPVVSVPEIVTAPTVTTQGGIRKAYEAAKRVGLNLRHLFTSEEVNEAIEEPAPPDDSAWTFDDEEIGTGPLVARSTDGKMYARMEVDGSGELILYGYPDAFNRSDPNVRFKDDVIVAIQSFDKMAQMLTLLVEGADPIIDASLAKVKQNSLNRQADVTNSAAAMETPPPPTEQQVHNMTVEALASKFGLMDFVHSDGSYNADEMAVRLADAYDIPKTNDVYEDYVDANGADQKRLLSSTPIATDVLMDSVMTAAKEAGDVETV